MCDKIGPAGIPGFSYYFFLSLLFGSLTVSVIISSGNRTHAAAPITPSGLNTQVKLSQTPPAGKIQYDITGGTRPEGGLNLYHSFGNFNVPTNNIANFLNSGSVDLAGNSLGSGLPTSSILDGATGGAPSSIFGTIQTNGAGGFGHANFLLMNPAEVIFPSRIGRSEMQACYLHVGEKYDSSFSTLTPGDDLHLNVAPHGRPPDGAAAKLGG